jgi:hypothetical protein
MRIRYALGKTTETIWSGDERIKRIAENKRLSIIYLLMGYKNKCMRKNMEKSGKLN